MKTPFPEEFKELLTEQIWNSWSDDQQLLFSLFMKANPNHWENLPDGDNLNLYDFSPD